MDVPADENTMEDIEAEISKMLFDNRKRAIDAVKDGLPRCSSGNLKFPEDIWMAARQIVSAYDEAMAVSALILAERLRKEGKDGRTG